jgi:hypothetical protein
MNQLDLCGTSGIAVFLLAMQRGLDVLVSLPNADCGRVAVAGLSGGGWQTIFLSSLDTRVRLANPVAGYSSFRTRARHLSDLGDSEQTPSDLATVADYTHLTALLAPRAALLTYNSKDDCCFASAHALPPLLQAAGPVYELYGKPGSLHHHVNDDPGTHNFERENREALYSVLGEHFHPGVADYPVAEIPSDAEVKTAEELEVPLPERNATFHTLALELSTRRPEAPGLPRTLEEAEPWRLAILEALRDVAREETIEVAAEKVGSREVESSAAEPPEARGLRVTLWRLRAGEEWTVPATEIEPEAPSGTAVLIADAGRASAAAETSRLLAEGLRVLALDPFYLGESAIHERDYLWPLLVAAVGERPLGIQASEVTAAARWLCLERGLGAVRIVSVGPRTGVAALVAGALEPQAIGAIELTGALGSLREVIEKNAIYNDAPELFCFGLLGLLDVRHLVAAIAPRAVRFRDPSDRTKAEIAGLDAWYRLQGVDFDPLR